jgi:predicted phosphodiesterase
VSAARSVTALYQIHGNLPALDAVLAELRRDPPDTVVTGGDVAAGPMPREVLDRLRELPWPVHWLRGNADRAVVMGFDGTIPPELRNHPLFRGDAWAATFLDRADRDFLAALPPLVTLEIEGLGDVLFCHATARSGEEQVTTATPPERLARVLAEAGADVVVAGHAHRQFDRTAGGRRLINAGSVGRPYEHRPGAYWLRLGPDATLICSPCDTAAAAAAFHDVGYPAADLIFTDADPDEVAEFLEGARAEPVAEASLIAVAENPLRATASAGAARGRSAR